MSELNWDLLRYFNLVACNTSVSQAARVAGVSHATVLRAINRLEKQLSVRLFDHIQTGYRLTPQGEELLGHVTSISEEVSALERRASAAGEQPSGELRISLPHADLGNLMPVLRDFQQINPRISFSLVELPEVHEATLMSEDIKLAFTLTNSPPENLVGRQLSKVTLQAYGETGTSQDWIVWGKSAELLDLQRDAILRHGTGQIRMSVESHAQARVAMENGLGNALLVESTREKSLDSPAKVQVGLWVLTHPDLRRDINVISLLRHLADARI